LPHVNLHAIAIDEQRQPFICPRVANHYRLSIQQLQHLPLRERIKTGDSDQQVLSFTPHRSRSPRAARRPGARHL
jgi:hypothetical protein